MMNSSSRTLRNIGYNFAGALVPLLITLFTVPVYLHIVGTARYGVILVAWSLLGYFGFMDLGISRATTHALSKIAHGGESEAKARVFWSSLIINGSLGIIGGVVMYALGSYLISSVLRIDPSVHAEAVASVPYIAAMLPMALMLGVGVGAAEAHDRFGLLNIVQTLGLILGQALPLLAVLLWGPSLLVIMPVMFAVRLFTFIGVTLLGIRVSGIGFVPIVDFKLVRELLGYGSWVTVTNIISPLMTSADQFVIGALRNVSSIPFYAVPLNIISRTLMLPTTLTRTLFPTLSRMDADAGDTLIVKALMHLSTVMTVVYICGVFGGGPFLKLWLGQEMALRGAPIFQLLCIGAWANSFGFILFTALQSRGNPRIVATIHTAEVLPYLVLLYFLVRSYGIYGAAIAWTIRVTVDAIALAMAVRIGGRCTRTLVPGAIALLASLGLARYFQPNLIEAAAGAIIMIGAFLLTSIVTNDAVGELVRIVRARRRIGATA